jgi:predicted transcriptional regulator
MARTKHKNNPDQKWIVSDTKLTQDEFAEGIRKAEAGPFHSVQESMENFEKWLKNKEKK